MLTGHIQYEGGIFDIIVNLCTNKMPTVSLLSHLAVTKWSLVRIEIAMNDIQCRLHVVQSQSTITDIT